MPQVPEKETEVPTINAYRSLGMMILLDICYQNGESENIIENYYANLLDHLRLQSVYVSIGNQKKPIGYVTWKKDDDYPHNIQIERQSAPFGDHLQLLKKWMAHIQAEETSITSIHQRSARRVQKVW